MQQHSLQILSVFLFLPVLKILQVVHKLLLFEVASLGQNWIFITLCYDKYTEYKHTVQILRVGQALHKFQLHLKSVFLRIVFFTCLHTILMYLLQKGGCISLPGGSPACSGNCGTAILQISDYYLNWSTPFLQLKPTYLSPDCHTSKTADRYGCCVCETLEGTISSPREKCFRCNLQRTIR